MLVLSRRRHESIVFPGIGVTVKVLRVEGNKATLGISAPVDVRILREEIDVELASVAPAWEHDPAGIGSIP